jgi:hypothetical protein
VVAGEEGCLSLPLFPALSLCADLERNTSRWFLKVSTCLVFIFLMFTGNKLKIWAPLATNDLSLAFFEIDGADVTIVLGTMILPLLLPFYIAARDQPLANLPQEVQSPVVVNMIIMLLSPWNRIGNTKLNIQRK